MPLQRYGTGFLKGLTNVAGQARADARADEDKKSRNALALLQLAAQSDDPVLLQSALETLSPDLGLPTATKGGKKAGAGGGKGDPSSMIAQLLLGGVGGGGEVQAPAGAAPRGTPTPAPPPGQEAFGLPAAAPPAGQGGLRISTAEETTAREQAKASAATQGLVARMRDLQNPGGTPMFTPEQIAAAVGSSMGVPEPFTGVVGPGGTLVQGGEPQLTTPFRPTAPANAQLVQRNRPGDPEGTPPSDFLFAPDTRQLFNMDQTPVTEALETRRAPPAPPSELDRRRIAALDAQAAQKTRYEAIPDNYRNMVDAATRRLPAAAQASTQADATDLWEQGDLAGLQRLIRNTVFEEADPTTRRQVEGRDTAMQALDEIEELFVDLAAEGVSTGKFAGTVERGLRYLGRTTSPRIAQLTTRIGDTVIAYRSAVSGAAFTESEGEAYEALFPSMGNTKDLNTAIIAGIRQSMQSRNQGFWKQRLGEAGASLVGAGETSDATRRLNARQVLLDAGRAADSAAVDQFLQNNPNFR